MRPRLWFTWLLLVFLGPVLLRAQGSQYALRFYGTGVGPPGLQDRVLLPVDDNVAGSAGNTPIDLGAGSFTLDFWLRGTLADNTAASGGGDVETDDINWIYGNIVLDRDIWCGEGHQRKYGVSLAGGLVRFGTSPGATLSDFENTIEGNINVLDGVWHHVAVVRDVSTGTKHIYVDGVLDFSSSAGVSQADLSYPDEGIPVTPGVCDPGQLTPYGWYLVIAAEKHDAGEEFPSFNGFFDELRLWNRALSASEIAMNRDVVVAANTPGLVGLYRFEEGVGTAVGDSSVAGGPEGELRAGTSGNGEWVSWADDPLNTAPIQGGDLLFADGFESQNTNAWSRTVP